MEVALSEIVGNGIQGHGSMSRELKLPSDTKRLKELINDLMKLLLKGDFFTGKIMKHDTSKGIVSRETSQMKKNFTNPATEVIPEEDEVDQR